MFKLTLIIGSLLAAVFSLSLRAQDAAIDPDKDRLYVTDQLRLSLYQQADAQSKVIKLLVSGDILIIEELSGPYAFVTAADGTRGWVKRGFLVTKPTSNLMLEEEKRKTRELQEEIDKLGNSKVVIDQYEKDLDEMAKKIEELQGLNEEGAATIAELKQEMEQQQIVIQQDKENGAPASKVLLDTAINYWQVIIPLVLGIMLLSFFVSKEIIETRIKKKFHGIKIW